MSQPLNIRSQQIASNIKELRALGILFTLSVKTGGRPATQYYVNEEQALLVCAMARTLEAKAVRAEAIRVFTAWWRDALVPVFARFRGDS